MTIITAFACKIPTLAATGGKKAAIIALTFIFATDFSAAAATEPASAQRKATIQIKYAFDPASHIAMPGWDRLPPQVEPADTGTLAGFSDFLPMLIDYRCRQLPTDKESDTSKNKPWLLPHPTESVIETLRRDLKHDPTNYDKRCLLYRSLAASGYWLGFRSAPLPDYHLAAKRLLESAWLEDLTQAYDHRQGQPPEGIVAWTAENQRASDGQYCIGKAVANDNIGQAKKDPSSQQMDEFFKLSKEMADEWKDVQSAAKPKSVETAIDFLPNRQSLINEEKSRMLKAVTQGGARSVGAMNSTKFGEIARIALAKNFFIQAKRENFEAAIKDFDATMRGAMPVKAVEALWNSWQTEYGKFEQIADASVSNPTGNLSIVSLHCKFERASRTFQLVIDKELKICGLHDRTVAQGFSVAPYVNPSSFWDEDIIIGEGQWLLPGSLSVPIRSDKMPAVVLVHGSGPNDRDETVGKLKPFRDLAWGLASRGIVVLRYEKRTKEHAAKISKILDKTTVKEETIDDALAAVRLLKNNKHVDSNRIFVLGHSLGGALIPRLALDDQISAGYIIMAGPARPLEDIILEQQKYLLSLQSRPQSDDDKKAIAAIEGFVAKVKDPNLSKDLATSGLPSSWPPVYWIDLRGYKPAEKAVEITKPLLIMQGGKDYQVTSADYQLWQDALKAKPNVTFKLYPDLAHPFTKSTGVPSPADYEKAQNVSQNVVEDLADWIKGQKPQQIQSAKPISADK